MAAPLEEHTTAWQVPEFRIDYERPRRARYAACVFVLNEGERIRQQLKRMMPLTSVADVVVADGGSTDAALTPEFMAAHDATALLVKTGPGKLSAQMRMAFAWAMRSDYEGVIVLDGNGKDGVEALPDFAARLAEGWDHVQGSRFIAGGHHEHTPLSRLLGLRLLHAPLISVAAGFHFTDTTVGSSRVDLQACKLEYSIVSPK